jgi:hypothetical protein
MLWKLGQKHGALGRKDGFFIGFCALGQISVAEMGVSIGIEHNSEELVATGGAPSTSGTSFRSELARRRGLATAVARGGGSMGMFKGLTLGNALGATLGAAGLDVARAPAYAACLASTGWRVGAERFGGAALGDVLLVAAPRAEPLGLTGDVIGLELAAAAAGWACEASMVLREGSTPGTALGVALRVESVEGPARGADDWGERPR